MLSNRRVVPLLLVLIPILVRAQVLVQVLMLVLVVLRVLVLTPVLELVLVQLLAQIFALHSFCIRTSTIDMIGRKTALPANNASNVSRLINKTSVLHTFCLMMRILIPLSLI
jgi:hypothetical protein